ncbi:MAG: homoserine dehydrogenase, partial [Armatimonadota bacterium]|nr:homoserine dehydrogenase [Armatimonadota bacterium]
MKIGLLGLGTVGSGVVEMLRVNGELIASRSGATIEVVNCLVKDPTKERGDAPGVTTDFDDIVNRDDIDV